MPPSQGTSNADNIRSQSDAWRSLESRLRYKYGKFDFFWGRGKATKTGADARLHMHAVTTIKRISGLREMVVKSGFGADVHIQQANGFAPRYITKHLGVPKGEIPGSWPTNTRRYGMRITSGSSPRSRARSTSSKVAPSAGVQK